MLKLQGKLVRAFTQLRTHSSCCAGASNLRLLGKMMAWSDCASQGMTRVTCSTKAGRKGSMSWQLRPIDAAQHQHTSHQHTRHADALHQGRLAPPQCSQPDCGNDISAAVIEHVVAQRHARGP